MGHKIRVNILEEQTDEQKKSKILIVDDDIYGSLALQNALIQLRQDSYAVYNGKQALDTV